MTVTSEPDSDGPPRTKYTKNGRTAWWNANMAADPEGARLTPAVVRAPNGVIENHSYCKAILGEMNARYRQFDVRDENRLKLSLISRYAALNFHHVRCPR